MSIDPELVAQCDQRMAAAAEFLDRITATESALNMLLQLDDAVECMALSVALDELVTAKGAIADALALAIRRLAARKEHKQ